MQNKEEERVVIAKREEEALAIGQFTVKMSQETQSTGLNPQVSLQASKFLVKHPQHGIYFIHQIKTSSDKWEVTGSSMFTFENPESGWIHSVYVRPEYRRRGVFKSLFNKQMQYLKEASSKKMKLLVFWGNQKAIAVYKHLGFKSYETDILNLYKSYADSPKPKVQSTRKILFQQVTNYTQDTSSFVDLLGMRRSGNKQIIGRDETTKQVVTYGEHFEQFSDWRFGRIVYLGVLLVVPGYEYDALHNVIPWISAWGGLKVHALHIAVNRQVKKEAPECMQGLQKQPFIYMQIDV